MKTICLNKKIIYIALILLLKVFLPSKVSAQDTFYAEFGLGGGGAFSLGDANGILFKNLQPYGSLYFKYKFNGYLALTAQAEGGLVGVSDKPNEKAFSKTGGVQLVGEFNFFNYGVKRYQEHYSWASPYVLAGLGVIFFDGQLAMTVPMGVGAKFKLSNRVNVATSWTVAKVLHDNFDGIDDPIGLNRNFWNNRDWYSSVQVTLSINFLKICAPCRNGVAHF